MAKNIYLKIAILLLLTSWANFPFLAMAAVYINEIMYDIEGSDDKKEWVEIYNDSANEISLKDWRFNDGSNHVLNEPPANGGRGSLVLPAYGYALLTSDATTTVSNYPLYSGIVIDTVMSLGNTAEAVKIIDASGTVADTVAYDSSMGANGDGKTLQKISGAWIAVAPTPGAANAGNGSSSSSSLSQNSSSAPSSAGFGGGSVSWLDEQQIYANAGKDKTGIAGADVLFEGKALGIKKEPLGNARYLWNFGDGSSGEGKNIGHTYKYPGVYIVVLDVSSGQYSVSDRMNVKIASNELIISEASDEFVRLKNKSEIILDISGWFMMGGGVLFKFLESSFVAANSELVISSDVSKIKFSGKDIAVNLLYPNGSVAFSYQNKKEIKPQPITPVKVAPLVASSSLPHVGKIARITVKKPEITGSQHLNGATAGVATVGVFSGTGKDFPAQEVELASVITVGEKDNSKIKTWFILAIATGIISGGGIFLARKLTYTGK